MISDIRGSHCNIWEPADLLRNYTSDESSKATSKTVIEVVTSETKVKISSVELQPKLDIIFRDNSERSISLYNLKTGAQIRQLYRHTSLVHILAWWSQRDIVITADVSNRINECFLKKARDNSWAIEEALFHSRLDYGQSIIQVLLWESVSKIIVSTRESDHFWVSTACRRTCKFVLIVQSKTRPRSRCDTLEWHVWNFFFATRTLRMLL